MGTYTGTPRTWVAGETVTAALLNSDIRDPLTALAAAWTSYTPTVGGWTLGNGTVTGYSHRFGKTGIVSVEFTFGSASAAASANVTFTLPAGWTGARSTQVGVAGHFYDTSGSALYIGAPYLTATVLGMGILGTSGLRTTPSTTTPFTWTTGDVVRMSAYLELA